MSVRHAGEVIGELATPARDQLPEFGRMAFEPAGTIISVATLAELIVLWGIGFGGFNLEPGTLIAIAGAVLTAGNFAAALWVRRSVFSPATVTLLADHYYRNVRPPN